MARESPIILYPPQDSLPTPSPFSISFSVASTRLSSQPSFRFYNLFLRFFALIFSFISTITLACPSPQKGNDEPSTFLNYPELMYCFITAMLASIYSAYQLFKGVCDISYRGRFISDKTSDYTSFILDQLVAYLLISSSSVSVLAIDRIVRTSPLRKAVIVSSIMAYIAFFVVAICALLSGYENLLAYKL
ncbi:Uncharacterized protein family UPF0497 [Macleaya cordata]|uniref:CASP-like protein n=1 Tax=Macleaya cordata TaxID=56857 RepID=A0A200QUH8_MACCD|nr:Uncharacterized protein family UPF0497 [Macleaya cordata]